MVRDKMSEETVEDSGVESEELVKSVGFTVEGVEEGRCIRCKEEGSVIQLTALIYYPGRNSAGQTCVVESRWTVEYCEFCFRKMVHPEGAIAEDDSVVDVSYQ